MSPVFGVCNGFQILCEGGLLRRALVGNASLHFESREVYPRVERPEREGRVGVLGCTDGVGLFTWLAKHLVPARS